MARIVTTWYEPTDSRLGRHVQHDERSRSYDLAGVFGAAIPSTPIDWHRDDADVFDQGDIGCCTAAAALGLLMTEPFKKPGRRFTLSDVLDFYSAESRVDGVRGVYPPDDIGSTGLAAMRVMRARGYATGYRHAFSPASALAALPHGPVALGIPWLSSMFVVRRGVVVVDRNAPIVGGHEVVADGWDPSYRRVRITNSWGLDGWQGADHGRAWLRYSDFAWLLAQRGDVVQPIIVTAVTPRRRSQPAAAPPSSPTAR